jgi:predicted regulator of Ras-like GTPase activity (Roadblock/LC7/MglB family)
MFQTLLKEVVDSVDGGLATLVMDFEGITVDSYTRPPQPAGGADFDINTVGAEFSVVIKSIQRAAEMLEAGETSEVTIHAGKVLTLIRVVSDQYFVAFTMRPEANLGKARYVLRTRTPAIAKELV